MRERSRLEAPYSLLQKITAIRRELVQKQDRFRVAGDSGLERFVYLCKINISIQRAKPNRNLRPMAMLSLDFAL